MKWNSRSCIYYIHKVYNNATIIFILSLSYAVKHPVFYCWVNSSNISILSEIYPKKKEPGDHSPGPFFFLGIF